MDLDSESDSDNNNNNNSFDMGVEIAHYKENDLLPANVDFSEFEDPPQQNPGDLGHFEMPSLSLDEPPLPHNLIHHNPPVNIQTWPDPPSDDPDSDLEDELELSCQIINGPDRDPEYVERDDVDVPHVDPDDEPRLTEEEMREALEFDFGDMLDNEWVEMYSRSLSDHDRRTLQLLATCIRSHFLRQTWDDLRFGACSELEFPSEFIAYRRLRILSGLETRVYDCCINSCSLGATAEAKQGGSSATPP
ncbi:hypothetical protein BN14_11525 [Rhizoctonia solani AG-1 IB]|uniref:Uncharacterized protein n=1 Tax=Thanatephorus cucumeris (strain AG1-IB / isolate 7/3/14) TaxID=1108050 RepID=M5CDX6_THACB|nr:hypothetical protein BN14_11525 [Rhizoctonia solani AG-1 IB]